MTNRINHIQYLYKQLLDREPDDYGLNRYNMSKLSIYEIQNKIKLSSERHNIISSIYKKLLDRDPDDYGLNYYLHSDFTINEINNSIKISSERIHIVNETYKKYLNRPSDTYGLNFYINSGLSVRDIINEIKYSNERSDIIISYYRQYLNRDPDKFGYEYYMDSDLSINDIKNKLKNSSERHDLIRNIYHDINQIPNDNDLLHYISTDYYINEINNKILLSNLKTANTSRRIPLNIFQTWVSLDLPPKMRENVDNLKKNNPEFQYHLYDDTMIRNFIKYNFNEEVLYTYDKLNSGAFKADLFRYCILYKYGGIYLDIKYKCINEFKLIYLTDKEYYVRDLMVDNKYGIYQALLICYPNNNILLQTINSIVQNVKSNFWIENNETSHNALRITGPLLLNMYFDINDIMKFELSFDVTRKYINYKNMNILEIYNEYRDEQKKYSVKHNYYGLYSDGIIYNYPILKSIKNIYFTRTITKSIDGQNIVFYSSTPAIIKHPNKDTYIMNIRWINYKIPYYPEYPISLNSRFEIDKDFNKITDEVFSNELYKLDKLDCYYGIEDIRLFYNNNNLYYSGTAFDENRKIPSYTCNIYTYNQNEYKISKNIITPDFYELSKNIITEKNWALFNYHNQLRVVYNWYPISIGKIDFNTNKLSIIEYKYNIPDCFKKTKGSTPGYEYNSEIWFVVHKSQKNNYLHNFVVFDLDMNLIRYSELFKFSDKYVEFCVGLIIEDDKFILSYSLEDRTTQIGIYSKDEVYNGIKWYDN